MSSVANSSENDEAPFTARDLLLYVIMVVSWSAS